MVKIIYEALGNARLITVLAFAAKQYPYMDDERSRDDAEANIESFAEVFILMVHCKSEEYSIYWFKIIRDINGKGGQALQREGCVSEGDDRAEPGEHQ